MPVSPRLSVLRQLHWRVRIAVLVLATACYSPDFSDGTVPCGSGGECPSGLVCGPDRKCYSEGHLPEPCLAGYERTNGVCTDVDECATGAADCATQATCTNSIGAYLCTCKQGYLGDGRSCTDVDECSTAAATCDRHADCANSPGSYTCACQPGYAGDGQSCAQSFTAISTAATHSCSLRSDGALYCWGANDHGQLGLGFSVTELHVPVRVGAASWRAIATAESTSCGIQADGSLWCWGEDNCGLVGDGGEDTRCESSHPVATPFRTGGAAEWRSVALSQSHACAVRTDGSLWCWGQNSNGELGTGDNGAHAVPTQVGTDGGWDSVSVGQSHTCGLRGGELWCWGSNGSGQLGDGGAELAIGFPKRIGMGAGWLVVAAGNLHTCGVLSDKTLACWGRGLSGQLGNSKSGADADANSPVTILGRNQWTTVAAGTDVTCARATTGALYCFGGNDAGQLGDGTFADHSSPVSVTNSTDWAQVSVGTQAVCAIRGAGQMWCWGWNSSGRLGIGAGGSFTEPTQLTGIHDWAQLAFGGGTGCGIRADRSLWCWGANSFGQLGIGVTGGVRDTPMPVMAAAALTWSQVAVGESSACAVTQSGALYCWGDNFNGQLGLGTSGANANVAEPHRVGTDTVWAKVSIRSAHTCAIRTDGSLWCWGSAGGGRLGDGQTNGTVTAPARVGAEVGWTAISAGGNFTCGIRSGTLYCWGYNFNGQIGIGQAPPNNPPVLTPTMVGANQDWNTVSAGTNHACALRTTNNRLYCWGYNYLGQIGNGSSGDNADATTPAAVGSASWLSVTAGDNTTCGVSSEGSLFCWGSNSAGLVGNRNAGQVVVTPIEIDGARSYTQVSIMNSAACALHGDGSYACWGQTAAGQFGDNTTFYETPTRVVEP